MTLRTDVKLEGKLTYAFQNDMRNLANFHRLKNSDFILESKIAELKQNKNLKQLDWPDAMRKLYFIYLGNKWIAQLTIFLCMFYRIVVLKEVYQNFQDSCENRWFSSMFSTYISRTWWLLLKDLFKNLVKTYHEELPSKAWSMSQHHIPQNIFFWKLLLDLSLTDNRILYFWQVLETIHNFFF